MTTKRPDRTDLRRGVRAAARDALDRRDPLWPGQLALLIAITLGFALPSELTIGPPWLVPGCEGAVLVGMIGMTPRKPDRETSRRRGLRLALAAFVSAMNVVALFLLARSLGGGSAQSARSLLVAGAVLWLTSVLLFAIWFWEFDGDGPIRRARGDSGPPDFRFPQTDDRGWGEWQPSFGDYLYLSLTNASTFGPAEMAPLTAEAKLMMGLQTVASLTTTTIVLAYAINNLH
jgi:uncharacterized membrane protein